MLPAGEFGGAESQILALLQGLRALEFEVSVATYFHGEFSEKAQASGIRVDVLQSGGMMADFRTLSTLATELRPDIIHTHGVRASVAGRRVGRRLSIKVVTTVHSDLFYDYASPLKRALFMGLESFTKQMSDRVIAVSQPLRHTLIGRGYRPSQVTVIENGMDVDRALSSIAQATKVPVDLRGEVGIPQDAAIVICVARLHPVKRHDVLIDAVARCADDRGADIHLVLVGDGSECVLLEERAKQKAPGRVHFLGVRQDVFGLLLASDIFALTSQMEGMPISVLEAMLAELPVVASRVGGLVDVIAEGERGTGILVPVGDVQAVADAILRLASQRDRATNMGRAGRAVVLSRFSLTRMAQQTADLYRELQK